MFGITEDPSSGSFVQYLAKMKQPSNVDTVRYNKK